MLIVIGFDFLAGNQVSRPLIRGVLMNNLIMIFTLVGFIAACTKTTSYTNMNRVPNKKSKIINGHMVIASDSQSKHTVGIYKKGETTCTGVIVSKNTVLTAAHCVDEMKNGKVSFGLQKNNREFREITDHIQHPEYDETVVGLADVPANDLMVLKFKGALPFGFEPAEISNIDIVQDNIEVVLSGFGRDEDNQYDVLKSTTVKVIQTAPYEFRTSEKKSGSCDGDSGGPVFFRNADEKYTLVGSVSRGDMNCNLYGIYENMTYYKNWINDSISRLQVAP